MSLLVANKKPSDLLRALMPCYMCRKLLNFRIYSIIHIYTVDLLLGFNKRYTLLLVIGIPSPHFLRLSIKDSA